MYLSSNHLTVGDLLKEGKSYLKSYFDYNYSLDAELLLSYTIGITREALISKTYDRISLKDVEQYHKYLKDRSDGKSVAHIIGSKYFWKDQFIISYDTLIPRPESELLIEEALAYIAQKQWQDKKLNILDLGCGSGCLAISLLKELPNSRATAVDFSDKALEIADRNAHLHQVKNRWSTILSNWFEKISTSEKFDIILCNPPYIPLGHKEFLSKEVLNDPHTALFAGDDGLEDYKKILMRIGSYMHSESIALLEFGENQATNIQSIALNNNLRIHGLYRDLQSIERVIALTI